MKFSKIPYVRPSIDAYKEKFNRLLDKFENAASFEEQNDTFVDLYKHKDAFLTMFYYAVSRNYMDTANQFFQEERAYFDKVGPITEELRINGYKALLNAKYRKELEAKWGKHIFNLADLRMLVYNPSVAEELQEENRLKTAQSKFRAQAKFELEGKNYNFSDINALMLHEDRNLRKKAAQAKWDGFANSMVQYDDFYTKFVNVRHRMARKLGFEDYTELGYRRMNRMDYDEHKVADFRKYVVKHIVPIVFRLRERQRKRLGCDQLQEYDLKCYFKSGNPRPNIASDEILDKAQSVYNDLSPETGAFFDYMRSYELMDLESRDNKAGGAYFSPMYEYKHPFIFANFTGAGSDIRSLTHESGHAFQYFCNRDMGVQEYRAPSIETCEIHSLSMELFVFPHLHHLFGEEEAEKYRFAHLSFALMKLPYICAVDHFQHIVYKNPEFTPDERANAWKELEGIYLPDYHYEDSPYLESGRHWHQPMHVFNLPFYYIDYALAQICAFQFWQKGETKNGNKSENQKEAWDNYLNLCKAGGTKSFLELLKLANLESPFEEETVRSIANFVENYVNNVEDNNDF